MYNGIKSFADTAHRIMGGDSNSEASEKLKNYVLKFCAVVFSDVPELQIHDYGYDRYGASLCATVRQDINISEAVEYAASLKSAIFKDFGYSCVIQPEVSASKDETLQVRHELRKAMQTLAFKVKATHIRVNRAKERTQVILLAELPFESGKDEASITTTLKALHPINQYDMIVKLWLGHSKRISSEYLLTKNWHNKLHSSNSSFSKTVYPFIQDDCLECFGLERGESIYEHAENLYHELMSELYNYKTEAIKAHLGVRLFPLMAYYQALLSDGVVIKDALDAVRTESQKVAEQRRMNAQRLTKIKGAYSIFRMLVKSNMKRNFPDEGFKVNRKCCDAQEISFDVTHCIYAEICIKHGCPELCTVLCENDDIAFSGYMPKIRFVRTETIGTGAKKCDFHFINTAKSQK